LIPLDAFYFAFWYLESIKKTLGGLDGKITVFMVRITKFGIPIASYIAIFGVIGPMTPIYTECLAFTQAFTYVTDLTSFVVLAVVI